MEHLTVWIPLLLLCCKLYRYIRFKILKFVVIFSVHSHSTLTIQQKYFILQDFSSTGKNLLIHFLLRIYSWFGSAIKFQAFSDYFYRNAFTLIKSSLHVIYGKSSATWPYQSTEYEIKYHSSAFSCTIVQQSSGVPRNFFRVGGFNKFGWGQRADRTGIWGR
jgi:hypothetical protein